MKNKMIFAFLIIAVVLIGCSPYPEKPYIKISNRYDGGMLRMPVDRIVSDNLTHVVIVIPKREDGLNINYELAVK